VLAALGYAGCRNFVPILGNPDRYIFMPSLPNEQLPTEKSLCDKVGGITYLGC
jgi:hypothetical protein